MNNCKATMLIAKIIESSDKSEIGKKRNNNQLQNITVEVLLPKLK